MAGNRKKQNESYLTGEQDSSLVEGGKGNYHERMLMDKQSKGYQILREYVYFYGYDFCKICHSYDTQERLMITKNDFRMILNYNKEDFYLTAENIEEILTDAPHHFDGKDHYILYQELYQLLFSYPPKTKYSVAYLYGSRKRNPEDHQLDQWEKEIERLKSNFWDRKEKGEEWDFQYTELNRLEQSIMQSRRDENGEIIEESDELQNIKNNQVITENEIYEKSIRNLYMMNNETILKNFDTRIAQHMVKIIKPQKVVQLSDEQLEKLFEQNFAADMKRTGKLDKLKHYFEEDFEKVMKDHFREIKLNEDEIKLLHYRIWEDNNFGQFTYQTLYNWVRKNRVLKIRELRTVGLSEQDQRKILNKQEASAPKLFKELVKYAYSFGLNFLTVSLKPIIERDNYIMLNNIALYFKSLNIKFDQQDINDLKFYLANHGAIHLQDTNGGGFLNANMMLDTKKLIDLITNEAQKIAMHTIDFKQVGNKSKEQSRRSIQSKIIQGVVNKLTLKLRIYTDENDLIEEIKLRKVVADDFAEIDQSDLDLIFNKLQNVTQPSKYVSQRKIYLPEFIDFILGGPLFDDVLFQKINEYEKMQKIKDLGIQKDNISVSHYNVEGKQETDRSRNNTQNTHNNRNLVLDYDTLQEQQMHTNETEKSQLPGQFSFRPQTSQTNQILGANQFISTQENQENEEQPKKFQVITKESLQQQIIKQKKAQEDAKKQKTVSDSSKQGAGADMSFTRGTEQKENTNVFDNLDEIDDSWVPDYRKIALEDLIQKEKPKPGIDYIKGGFIYEEQEDAFVTKPIDDRQVVCKLYECLKRKVLIGKRADLQDYDAVDYVILSFKNKLQAIDPTLRGVITVQQFYSFIKLNFQEFTPQECYQLKNMAETYAGADQAVNDDQRNISYTYFCMNLHKFICSNILFNTPTNSRIK